MNTHSAVSQNSTPVRTEGGKDREFSLDFLRAFAIIEVVLAHTQMPALLFEMRNFGVPLLIMLSGMSFAQASKDKNLTFWSHMRKRVLRLAIPVWLFLIFYFVVTLALHFLPIKAFPYSLKQVIGTFAFMDGIGYVWVIRVNLIMSMFAVFFFAFHRHVKSNALFLAALLAVLLINEMAWYAFEGSLLDAGVVGGVIRKTLFFAIAYGSIFLLGIRIESLSMTLLLMMAAGCLVVYAAYLVHHHLHLGGYQSTQLFKYPPRLYYLAYALTVSLLAVTFRHKLAGLVTSERLKSIISFIGSNTLWIYLWHILVLDIAEILNARQLLSGHFLVIWLFTIVVSTLAVMAQKRLAAKWNIRLAM